MNKKVLIVEDQFVEANDLQIMLRRAGYEVCGIARSVETAREIVAKEKPGLVLLDIFLKGNLTGIDLARELKKDNIAFIYLSANSNEEILAAAKTTEPGGFIVKPFREKDLLVTLEIARYRHEQSSGSREKRETELLEQLEKIADIDKDGKEKLFQAAKLLQQEIPFDYLVTTLDSGSNMQQRWLSFLRIGFNEYQVIGIPELATINGSTIESLENIITASKKDRMAAFFNQEDFENLTQQSLIKKLAAETFQLKSLLSFPVQLEHGETFILSFYSRRPDTYHEAHRALLYRLQNILVNIIQGKPGSAKIYLPKDSLAIDKIKAPGFEGMIGGSHLLLNVFDLITQVAPFDTSVLILGESGTGKEKIAECIHQLSPRQEKSLIKINCALLPASLIESELFGHEKGSFTGADHKRIGKFELAKGGTIFLDEIGEMPVDLQAKLLRVLQEKEIEPIGGRSPVRIDVRVIAATNRNLEKEVGEGRFRLDLYYRLNVFPIQLPPLRERLEDIAPLCQHFISIYNRKCGKKITGISESVLQDMMNYSWPGNIRELENIIERSILLSKGSLIEDIALPSIQMEKDLKNKVDTNVKTIHENEREYIISVLKRCKGKIWGEGGAAEVLKVPPTTLKSKMKKLGIPKDSNE